MRITVKLFATLRQNAGWSDREFEIAEGATVESLLAWLDEEVTELEIKGRPLYVAVDQEYAQPTRKLEAGDVVALFPPVSGGVEPSNRCRQRVQCASWMRQYGRRT